MDTTPLKCAECYKSFQNLDKLAFHIKFDHGSVLGKPGKAYVCGQHGCCKTFNLFSSFKRHIRQEHLKIESDKQQLVDADLTTENGGDNLNELMECIPTIETKPSGLEQHNKPVSDDYFKWIAGKVMCNLLSKSNMTVSLLGNVIDGFDTLISAARNDVVTKFINFLKDQNFDTESNDCKTFLSTLETDSGHFSTLNRLDTQFKYFKDNLNLIEPIEINLGGRIDVGLDKATLCYEPVLRSESCQYIPIIKTIQSVFSKVEMKDTVDGESSSKDGFLRNFIDGESFKTNEFFKKFPNAVRLQVYYDDLEVTNPLGSKTSIHKVGAFYFTIQNVSAKYRSCLGNIHLLTLCNTGDVTKYGFNKILKPFFNDLEKLESEEGVKISISGKEVVLHGTLAAFCADGLAVHQIYGMLQPAAKMFCRMCLISREELHAGRFAECELRTKTVFENHVELSSRNPAHATQTGVRSNCVLNHSKYFHCAENYVFDPMHDLLEGLCSLEIKLVLHRFIVVDKYFNVHLLNDRIATYNYGFCERKNKPSANFNEVNLRNTSDHHIKQRAMQTWCLTRVLPFLISDKIPPENAHLELIILLLKIMEIVFSPKLSTSILPYLEALITDHNLLYKKLFPEHNYINKHHHLVHYPRCIQMFGPISQFWCMRFEAKHNILKKHAMVCCNFKNIPKTMARMHQVQQCAIWGCSGPIRNEIECKTGSLISVNESVLSGHADLKRYKGEINRTNNVVFNGTEYRPGLFICIRNKNNDEENCPLFGCIKEILVLGMDNVLIAAKEWKTEGFEYHLNAYKVEDLQYGKMHGIYVDELVDHKPFTVWRDFKTNLKYVSLRNIIL